MAYIWPQYAYVPQDGDRKDALTRHSKRLLMKSLDSPGARTSVPHGADCNQLSPSKFTSITDSFLRKTPEMANIGSKTRADL